MSYPIPIQQLSTLNPIPFRDATLSMTRSPKLSSIYLHALPNTQYPLLDTQHPSNS